VVGFHKQLISADLWRFWPAFDCTFQVNAVRNVLPGNSLRIE